MFGVIGGFAVRHRLPVVVGWLAITVAAVALLPSLGSVIRNDNTAFLPSSAPSVRAARLARTFLLGGQLSGTIIAVRTDGPLTGADQRAFSRFEASARRLPSVVSVRDASISIDGQARTASVEFASSTAGGGRSAAAAVAGIRATFADVPSGLVVYLTGPLPELVDQQHAANRTAGHVQLLSVILILILLGVAFRSFLAPLATLAPAALALALAGPLIAESAKLGVQISSLMQLLLTALVLGAGTDYSLFLVFRYRENLRAGLEPEQAIRTAVERVGESIGYSAATVIAALLTLLLASFGLYRGVGPGLAIGIAVTLLIELTFFPALLAILGRALFLPAVPRPGPVKAGWWGIIAVRVTRHPVVALVTGTLALSALALALSSYAPSGFDPGGFIAGSDSQMGEAALEAHFGVASLAATDVVFRLPRSVWGDPAVIERAGGGLLSTGQFTSLDDALSAGGVRVNPSFLGDMYQLFGSPASLPPVAPGGFPAQLYDLFRASAQFISPNGRTILFRVALRAGAPGGTAALQAVPAIRAAVASVAAGIGATGNGVAGQAAGAADVSSISGSDIVRIAPVVLVVLTLLLALVLRSLIAPLYLVASVALSYLASLGLAVLIFVVAGGQLGINFTLPFFMFVFIMALGEDYNILIMTRIREEARRAPLREAVATALASTGTTVTSAGLVLSGTFAVLALATSGQIRQIGTGLSLGILLDTFLVRTLLVPSAAVLVGRWNWWPSRHFSGPPTISGPVADGSRPRIPREDRSPGGRNPPAASDSDPPTTAGGR
jgi:putative drug exporter of the RND superfamily